MWTIEEDANAKYEKECKWFAMTKLGRCGKTEPSVVEEIGSGKHLLQKSLAGFQNSLVM